MAAALEVGGPEADGPEADPSVADAADSTRRGGQPESRPGAGGQIRWTFVAVRIPPVWRVLLQQEKIITFLGS